MRRQLNSYWQWFVFYIAHATSNLAYIAFLVLFNTATVSNDQFDLRNKIPWWLLVSFGSYSLWSLGWGLYTFRDCPEAYADLLSVSTKPHLIYACFRFGGPSE